MKAVGKIIRAPLKAIGLVPDMPKPPSPVRPVTRDDARDQDSLLDEVRRRQGGSADNVTGGGAEGGGGGRATLG